MISGGGRGDVSVLCERQRILEVVSNVLRLYVWCRERTSESCVVYTALKVPPGWRCHCVFVSAAVHLPRALAGSLRSAGRTVRRAAASDVAGEGAREGAGAA